MKNRYSLIACLLIGIFLIQFRVIYSGINSDEELKVTTWDALGYYMYLPAIFIYNDVNQLKWLPEVDRKYELSGGTIYQANRYTNGNYVFKYLGGVAILEAPFFFIGHMTALITDYEPDGFSPPYQYSIAFGAILYCFFSLFLLRIILLRYFSDLTTAFTLLFLILCTNSIQYISIDSAQSHAYIFPLYVLLLYSTIRWHEAPSKRWAALIGLSIGIATISRPTEAIMLFIPLLWGMHSQEESKKKWKLVKENKKHVYLAIIMGLIGVLPQMIYWKYTSGSFIYDVGSKWFFLNPFFRVLFGFENGWFIYTPITLFFIFGLLLLKKYPFFMSVIVFCLLNIWIIIAWSDWKYGATYSTRAMVQSLPIFALPFAAFINRINAYKWKYLFYSIALFLVYVNLFQIGQYNSNVLHYRDMNRKYYSKIYLNSSPLPEEMSLLDTDEFLNDESNKKTRVLLEENSVSRHSFDYSSAGMLGEFEFERHKATSSWFKVNVHIKTDKGFSNSYLHCKLEGEGKNKEVRIRLFNALCEGGKFNEYAFYIKAPSDFSTEKAKVFIATESEFIGESKSFKFILLN